MSKDFGLNAKVGHVENPRKEKEDHYYVPEHKKLLELSINNFLASISFDEIVKIKIDDISKNTLKEKRIFVLMVLLFVNFKRLPSQYIYILLI